MKYIESNNCRLEIGGLEESSFNELISKKYVDAKKIIIADENTHANCLEFVITTFDALKDAEVVVLPAGEEHKQMTIAHNVWEALTEYGVTRYDLIINIGGGLITDMGGFIASCYKRGCDFINIPTSLLAMVDASIGGKTGLNLGHYKNQIGVFSDPVAVFIDVAFLGTLPAVELYSGFGEMLKHGLISDVKLFDDVVEQLSDPTAISEDLIIRSIEVKNAVVKEDPLESGLRKTLNFGHTIGHVIEGLAMEKYEMTHGHCVALGMAMESYLSFKHKLIDVSTYQQIQDTILGIYQLPMYSTDEINEMIGMLSNDKKNKNGKILCCLIDRIGHCLIDQEISEEEFLEAFLHFKNMQINLN